MCIRDRANILELEGKLAEVRKEMDGYLKELGY